MSALFGSTSSGDTNASDIPVYTQLQVNTSAYGIPIPIVYGTTRVGNNLGWYANFNSTTTSSGGGGGGGKGGVVGGGGKGSGGGSSTTTYSADMILLLGEGEWLDIANMWNSQTLIAGTPNFSQFTGALGQAGWSYLQDNYPTQYSNYSGIVYLGAASFQLGTSANLPNFNFEVQAIFQGTAPSTYGGNGCLSGGDADPSLVVPDLLTNGVYGLGFPSNRIGILNNNYESHSIPGSGPFTVTVTNHTGFQFNEDVVTTGGLLYACCPNATNPTSTPNSMEYSYTSAGVYTFNSAQAGVGINIGYASLTALSSPSSTFSFKDFALAAGLWISPAYVQQSPASSMMDDIATGCYSDFVWTSGVLTVVPRGANDITANGYTYTANTNVLFSLGIDDFMKNTNPFGTLTAGVNDDPVIVSRTRTSDQINDVKIEWMDRANQYAPSIAEATDQALVDRYGKRTSAPKSLHMFCDANAANTSAYFQLQDQYIRNTYSIQVDERYCVLDPMDLIELTDPDYPGLTNIAVRITQVEENDDGTLSIVSEEYPGNVGNIPTYSLNKGSGFQPNFNESPGTLNTPILFGMPIALSNVQGLAIGAALSGTSNNWGGCHVYLSSDGTTYTRLSPVQIGPSRMGVLTGDFPVGSDPDITDTLTVNLSESFAMLAPGTQADADANNTLCLVGGANGVEFIAYEDATMTSQYNYSMSGYIRRGQQSTVIVDHPNGSPFCRVDSRIYQIPYTAEQMGETIYLKFTSFNNYGGGEELLSDVTEYMITLPAPSNPPDVTGFGVAQQGNVVQFVWNPVPYPSIALAGYDLGFAPMGTTNWNLFTIIEEASNITQSASAAIPPGSWTFGIRAANVAHITGSVAEQQPTIGLSPNITTVDLVVVNTNPVIYTQDEAPIWGGTLSGFIRHYTGVLTPDSSKTVDQYVVISAPSAPSFSQSLGGALLLRNYYGIVTWLDATGETVGSAETGPYSVLAANLATVTAPTSPPASAVSWNFYGSTTAGTETLQNTAPISLGVNWTEPSTGLTGTGQTVPSYNSTGWEVFDIFVPDVVALATYKTNTIDTGYDDSLRVFFTENYGLGFGETDTPAITFALDYWLTGQSDPNVFVPWPTANYVELRYFRGELSYAPVEGSVAYITDFVPTVDTTPVTEQSAGNITIAMGGTSIVFSPQFHLAPIIQVTANSSGSTGASAVNPTATGFDFHIWQGSSDTGGTGTWTATGE